MKSKKVYRQKILEENSSQKGSEYRLTSGSNYGLNPQIRALAILLLLSVALALGLLFWSAEAQDEITFAGSQQLAATALSIQQKTLRSTVTDYTYWDDAYSNISGEFSFEWYQDEFGSFPYLTDTFGITASLIVGPENQVVAYSHSDEVKIEAEKVRLGEVASGLAELVESARRTEDGEFTAESGFVELRGQPHIAAARIIHPHTEKLLKTAGVGPENAMIAVFIKPLDQDLLETIATDFGLKQLSFQRSTSASGGLSTSIRTIDGVSLGQLTWRIDRPSRHIFSVILPSLLAIVSIIGLLAWYLLKVIWNGQRSLFAAMLEAKAANRTKSEFLATMSHELRTPMNGVVGIAEILKCGELKDEQRALLDHILTAANDQLAIINDLLDMTRIEAGRVDLNDEVFDPTSVVRAAVDLMRAKAKEKGLELQVELPARGTPAVIGDPGRYKQVILNLLSNAIKFTEKGKVSVALVTETAGTSEMLTLSVEDTGIGIAEQDKVRVFERFTQADGSMKRKTEGTGLGLAICKALIEVMKGKISMTSALGKGTRVQVYLKLPLAQSDETRKVA